MTSALATVLRQIDGWGPGRSAVVVIGPDGIRALQGDPSARFWWASVTKPVTAWAVLVAVDVGLIDLDEPAGPPGATVRHLLAHASGLPFDGSQVLGAPGRRRTYSNTGFDALGALLAARTGEPFAAVLQRTILDPLGMTDTVLVERPSQGLHGTLADLAAFAGELLRPRLVRSTTHDTATQVAFPGLTGVVPGVGNFDPCDWGLGLEIHDGKRPHWMGDRLGPATFGHFGGSGAMLWVEPEADVALAFLTDRAFGPWALDVWPPFSDAVLSASAG